MAEAVVARLKAVLSGDSSQLRRDLDKASRNLDEFGKKAQRAGRQMTMRLTLPIVGAGAAAVKVAADFEKSMSKITALVGVAADEVASMEGTVRSMATTFGKSATEAADALFYITSAGLRGSTATDTLAASLKASAIGLGDTATIADLATSALNAYGSDVISASEATDVMTAAVREGKLEASELAGSMGRVLPLSSAMGVSFNEVGAAFAALSRTGTNAAEAATQIRGILSSLLRPTKQSEEALTGMGLSAEGLRTQIREEGLLSTLGTLAEKFEGNEAAAAAVFGNIRALSGVLDLMGANVATTEQIFANMADTTGTVDEAFAVMSDTASFKFAQAMAEVKEVMLTIGQDIMPLVTSIVETLSGAFAGLAEFIKGLPDPVKNVAIGLVAFAAAAGPAAMAIGALSTAGAALMANPMILAGATVFGGLATAIALGATKASEHRERVASLREEFSKIDSPLGTVTERFAELASAVADAIPEKAGSDAEALMNDLDAMTGAATVDAAILKAGMTDAFNAMNFDMGLLAETVTSGGDSFDAFSNNIDGAIEQMYAAKQAGTDVGDETEWLTQRLTNMGVTFDDNIEKLLDLVVAEGLNTKGARELAAEIGNVEVAYRDLVAETEAEAEALLGNADVIADLRKIYGDYTTELIANLVETEGAIGAVEVLSGALERHNEQIAVGEARMAGMAYQQQQLANATNNLAPSVDTLASALVEAGDMAGYDIAQIAGLVDGLNVLDSLSPEVRVELGLDVLGGEAILDLIDDLIRLEIESMGAISPDAGQFGFGGALGDLMKLRDSLAVALENPSTGGGRGGGSGASNAIDEVAQAAERAAQETLQLAQSVQQLGDSMMGYDFRDALFGADPDELADIFADLVDSMDSLGMITEDTAPAIAKIGEKFKAAASAAEELAQATQALADAQDELERRKQVVSDLTDDYSDFLKEFGKSGDDKVGILGGEGTGLDLLLDRLEDAIPKLRDAQQELDNLKNQQSQYKTSVADMFKPQLSADANVMAQTQRLLGQARKFRDNIVALRDKGFPPDVIAEVVNAGLIGGAKLGSQLLKLGGGELQEFLAMRAEISRLGAQTSQVAADVIFGADIADAQGAVDKQFKIVDNLFKQAIAEAQKQTKEQETVVGGLKEALEAATAQMQTLVSNIQVDLYNTFNDFLSGLDTSISTLTESPFNLSWNDTAINKLTNLIAKVTGEDVPGGENTGGGTYKPPPVKTPTKPIKKPPEQTYTVVKDDSLWSIAAALLGSGTRWREIAEFNGKDPNKYGVSWAIKPGDVLKIPALATGGFARKGMPHLVGEMGAELFVPDSSGYVVPNHMLGGGSQTVNVTINTHSGMRAEDIVREIERYTRRRGNLAIPTTSARRR